VDPKFNSKDAYKANLATGYLFDWSKAMYDFYKVFTETKPLRDQLEVVKKVVAEKKEELRVKMEALDKINAQIRTLTEMFEEKNK